MIPTYDTIWFDGPSGSGKTTLIEHLLKSATSYDLAVAHVRPGPSRKTKKKSTPDPDLKRFETSGAYKAASLRADPDRSLGDLDEVQDFQRRNSEANAVLFEGARVTGPLRGDFYVYILRPLLDGEELVFQGEKEFTRIPLNDYIKMETGVELTPEEPPPDIDESEWETVAEIPDEVGRQLVEWAEKGVPLMGRSWMTRPGHDGVVYGEVYVVNIHDEKERRAAERTAEEIRRIRADGSILRCFHGSPQESRRISVFISNLVDKKDPELKKVLARLKRGIVRTRDSGDW